MTERRWKRYFWAVRIQSMRQSHTLTPVIWMLGLDKFNNTNKPSRACNRPGFIMQIPFTSPIQLATLTVLTYAAKGNMIYTNIYSQTNREVALYDNDMTSSIILMHDWIFTKVPLIKYPKRRYVTDPQSTGLHRGSRWYTCNVHDGNSSMVQYCPFLLHYT